MADKVYWKSLDEREGDPALLAAEAAEMPEPPLLAEGLRLDRRGLLKGFAAVFGGAALAACTRGVAHKAIPLLVQPEEAVTGRALWYATTCRGCAAGCGALAKVRDGRPIKLEGNPGHPVNDGALCASGQGQVLSLYDPARLRGPRVDGAEVSWERFDEALEAALAAAPSGKAVWLVTGALSGPGERAALEALRKRFPKLEHLTLGAPGIAAIRIAHERTHGVRALPRYRIDRAKVLASFACDFLGTWLSPVEHTRGYRAARALTASPPDPLAHWQIEADLSLTGTNADHRVRLTPAELPVWVAHLVARLAAKAGLAIEALGPLPAAPARADALEALAKQLWARRGQALCVCAVNDPDLQTLVNLANHLLGAYGQTIDLDGRSEQDQADDPMAYALIEAMHAGEVGAVLLADVDPVVDLPSGARFAAGLERVPVTLALTEHLAATAHKARFVAASTHALEAWGDAEPLAGALTLSQPAIAPLGKTRTFAEVCERLAGGSRDARTLLRDAWRALVLPRAQAAGIASATGSFDAFFDGAVHDGYVRIPAPAPAAEAHPSFRMVGAAPLQSVTASAPESGTLALVLYTKVAIRSGRDALNPWLQELPDPVTKSVWQNYAKLSPATAKAQGVDSGDEVTLRLAAGAGGAAAASSVTLPVLVQPGLADDTVAVALHYGRLGTERFATVGPRWIEARPTTRPGAPVGVDASSLLVWSKGCAETAGQAVTLERTGKRVDLAITQDHHSLFVPPSLAIRGHERRAHVQETTLVSYRNDPHAGGHAKHPDHDLWRHGAPAAAPEGPRWALAVDLHACTGCSACVVGCQAENNIPVVGKDEVRRHREMHWLRIDRYYAGEGDDVDVVHQPMLCQHCDNAPCETVCPVLATVQSKDGLNQQVYNRCVGTRYCANNCPYKVRRFNWFEYAHGGPVERLVLNPDVTVRSRGVMEKCSFCVQRIQEARSVARAEGREVRDGDIRPACEQSCPASAIVFGDAEDPGSAVSRMLRDPRAYAVLEELNVRPRVRYLTKVRTREDEQAEAHGHG